MNEESIVVGGGMTGIVAAYLLAQEGRRVTLIEPREALGGVNTGRSWEGFCLDFGCHLFGNESDVSTATLLDLMDHEVTSVSVRFASILGGVRTEGFELPDLTTLEPGRSAQALFELIAAAAEPNPPAPGTLEELLTLRYGVIVTKVLCDCLEKALRVSARELAPEAIAATTFRRVRIVEDRVADLLKQLPALDERIARGSADDPMCFYRNSVRLYPHRSFYPATRGMLGFAERATRKLKALGVRVVTGEEPRALELEDGVTVYTDAATYSASELIWTLGLGRLEPLVGGVNRIIDATHSVPMVLYYFAIDKSQETGMSYVNSFDSTDLVFRASVPGSYGPETCPEGLSYVCCEVPTSLGSPVWSNPEDSIAKVWEEAIRFGVATGTYQGVLTQKAKTSYKAPRADFWKRSELLSARLARQNQIFVPPEWSFSTSRTILELVPRLCGRNAAE